MKRLASGAFKNSRPKAGFLSLSIEPQTSDLPRLLSAADQVQAKLYVQLRGNWANYGLHHIQSRLTFVYSEMAKAYTNLDVRVLLPSPVADTASDAEVFFGFGDDAEKQALKNLDACRTAPLRYELLAQEEHKASIATPSDTTSDTTATSTVSTATATTGGDAPVPSFTQVCIGGTCDRLHPGHKLLFSLAALVTSERLVVGVTSSSLLGKKTLAEFIQPCTLRSVILEDFLASVKPQIRYELVEIMDPCGPAITDSTLKAIVVSEETKAGAQMCNNLRKERDMSEMETIVVDLVDEADSRTKLSSTTLRLQELAKFRGSEEGWSRRSPSEFPYTVGLTGGIACGKSTVGKAIAAELNTPVIDCDLLGHEAYLPGSDCFKQLVECFGAAIVADDGTIDRRKLGPIVFGDPLKLDQLNGIVRPVILSLLRQRLVQLGKEGVKLVFVEAAILFEADWDHLMDESWVVIVPPLIARQRLVERNKITLEQADQRLQAQMSNLERIQRANLVISSHSDEAGQTSRDQLRRAWPALLSRAECRLSTAPERSVAGHWRQLMRELGVEDYVAARWWRDVRDRYAGPERYYHGLAHVEELLGWFEKYKHKLQAPELVKLAIFFHDVIYVASRGDNEAASAEMFERFASQISLDGEKAATVKAWILRTAKHMAGPASGDLAYFLDFDLAVLGKEFHDYAEYAYQIRLEYHHVPSNVFNAKRPEVLQSFLKSPTLYFTEDLREEMEAKARRNLVWEIQKLRNSSVPS